MKRDKEAHPRSHPVPLPPTFLVSRVMVPKRALGRPQGWGTGRWFQVGLRRTGPRHGGTGSDSELGARAIGGRPGKRARNCSLPPPENKAGARSPGRSVRALGSLSRGSLSSPPASRTPSGAAERRRGGDAPDMGLGRAPGRSGHLRRAPPTSAPHPPTRAGSRRCPQEAPPEWARGGGARPWPC